MLTLDAVNAMAAADFVAAFGDIAEHSPFVAEAAAGARPFADRAALVEAFQRVVADLPEDRLVSLLQAHPDLAGRAARAGLLARDSAGEQAGAGLDSLSDEEFARFTTLNRAYQSRFGFPFILAVRGADKHRILDAFATRVGGSRREELMTATAQVLRIMRFRLEDRVAG